MGMGIRVRDLARSFKARQVFVAPDIEFHGAGRVVLSGANGSGKTTFLRILATLMTPSSGEAWINGDQVVLEVDQLGRLENTIIAAD